MPDSSALRIELLGGFRVLADNRALPRLPGARQQQLIAYLVLYARDTPVLRQRIAGSLWPESNDVQALTNLRRELHHLRETWPALDALVDAGSRTLAWRTGRGVTVDVIAFDAAADRGLAGDRGALEQAARLYRGDLMPECTGDWIDGDRERLRQRAAAAPARLLKRLEDDRAFGDAIDCAQQLLRLDSLDEQAWCALMRSHARRGERATALYVYQQCAGVLKKELGIQPSAATRITYREILDLDDGARAVPAPPRAAVYPLVGRQAEWQALVAAWKAAAAGRPRFFLIRGDAGIGKTRLAEELVDWCRVNGVAAVTTRCYAGEGRLAYAPIAAWLKSDIVRSALMKLDAARATDVARLCPDILVARPDVPDPDRQLESWQRLRFFEALTEAFRAAAPLALVVDDLQWADGDTIEWLQFFVRALGETPCLIVGTVRSGEEHDNQPLGRLVAQFEREDRLTAIVVGPLDQAATAQLAGEVAEHPLDEAAIARTFRETEGHPLFIVERGRMDIGRQPGSAPAHALPQVQAVVAARLALLSEEARGTAEVAAAVGRDFEFDILGQASDLEEDALVRALDELWRRHIVRVQADQRWDFSHDRIREVAYAGIGPARRRLIHRRIAQAMEILFADRLDEVSASIGAHLDRGGLPARAIPFLERAAAVAARVSASEEAIRRLVHALSLLDRLPAGRDRDDQEMRLRSSLSVALNSGRGYAAPEVEQNLHRVFALSRSDAAQVPVRWLWAAFTLWFMLGDLKRTRDVSEQALATSATNPSCQCEAHHAMGGTLLSVGELEASRDHFEAALAAYDEAHPQQSALGSDLGVFAHAWYSHTLWLLGDERAALEHSGRAIVLAERLDHMYSQALAHAYAALLHQLRLDTAQVLASAETAVALCRRHDFAYYGDWAQVLIGWARGQERPQEGVRTIEGALERLDGARAQARRPYYLSLLADVCAKGGDHDRSSAIVHQAMAMALERGDLWWLPALYLQKAGLDPLESRDETVRHALALARAQNSRGLERRIVASAAPAPL